MASKEQNPANKPTDVSPVSLDTPAPLGEGLPIGFILSGRYLIERELARGGIGVVYLARDQQLLSKRVVVKTLLAESLHNAWIVKKFRHEMEALARLEHPGIVSVLDAGETADKRPYLVMEYVDGVTLRSLIKNEGMDLERILRLIKQIGQALGVAHEHGVLHRDLKPENIMLLTAGDGEEQVKLIDFGIAKIQDSLVGPSTVAEVTVGTIAYMSPEQLSAEPLLPASDIYSLGIIAYEMVTGRRPFNPDSVFRLLEAQRDGARVKPKDLRPRLPEAAQEVILKALSFDPKRRYQRAREFGDALAQALSSEWPEFGLQRSAASDVRRVMSESSSSRQALYLVSEIKRHKKGAMLLVILAVVLAASVASVYFQRQQSRALTDKDTVLIADFLNTTGEAVFDGTLQQALAAQLEQSPFLSIFPDEGVREALRYMGRSPDERVTRDVAREICQRHGIKALLAGSISGIGSHYVITLEAISANAGSVISREQVEAETKEQVLMRLGQAASKLRERLGEALSSIQKFDAPIEQVTTSSLEALKAFSLGQEMADIKGMDLEAIPFFKRAIELDPNFALAYARLGERYYNTRQYELAAQWAAKAFELRERVSEHEKLYISAAYYEDVTGEIDKAIEVYELWKSTYPRDDAPPNNLANDYLHLGQYEKAIEEAREAIRRNPNDPVHYQNMATALQRLDRFDEAKQVLEQALAQKSDAASIHSGRYQIAFFQGDTAAMKQELDWFGGKPTQQFVAEALQAQTAVSSGQLHRARDFYRRGMDLTQRPNMNELAARFSSFNAASDALLGNCQQAKEESTRALAVARSRQSLVSVAYALALCGEINQSQTLADELERRYPKRVLLIATWLPIIRAEIELQRHNPTKAIELLQATTQYEIGLDAALVPAYVRGQAYLVQGAGAEAMAEFQKILDHKGTTTFSALYPPVQYALAHLGLARAAAVNSDTSKSRRAYQDFFALWQDADPDIPMLEQARREYDQLK